MRSAAISILAVIGLAGCEPIATDTSPPVPSVSTPSTDTPSTGAPATNNPTSDQYGATDPAPAPDNTKINERDASGATKTPIDQNENQADVNTTAEIRKRIVAQEGMSINGQNAKVVTANGKVTLRGPVENQSERDTIDRIAREVAGDANVDNQLEIANP